AQDLLITGCGGFHFRLHTIGGFHALADFLLALIEQVRNRTATKLPEKNDEDRERNQLNDQFPAADSKRIHAFVLHPSPTRLTRCACEACRRRSTRRAEKRGRLSSGARSPGID